MKKRCAICGRDRRVGAVVCDPCAEQLTDEQIIWLTKQERPKELALQDLVETDPDAAAPILWSMYGN